jgi:hypothetical protein
MGSDAGDGPDPDVEATPEALDRVRRDLAGLGSDEASAPDAPAAVTARIAAALRAAPPHHAVRRSPPRLQVFGLVVGVVAAMAAAVLGGVMLIRGTDSATSAGPTAESITVSRPPRNIPLSDPQIVGLLSRGPDYGPLADPKRRTSCLKGLGYSAATNVLGARPVDMFGRPGVLLLLPGETPREVVALVVEPNCSSAHTGLLANTVVTRP